MFPETEPNSVFGGLVIQSERELENARVFARPLDGRVALITGTGGGQGRAAAKLFAAAGAIVHGTDINPDGHKQTIEMVHEAGGTMTGAAPVDLSDDGAAKDWVDEAVSLHGGIDIVYNNASDLRWGPIDQLSVEDWHYTLRNELDLVFFVTRHAWPHLKQRRGGVVINTASINGQIAMFPENGLVAHAATKGGIIGMTRQIAGEGAEFGIRALSISPGAIVTEKQADNPAYKGERKKEFLRTQLVKRLGESTDIAGLAVFLASDAASFMSGVDVTADGGFTAL